MALTSGMLDQYWMRRRQQRALTGLPSSYQQERGMLDPMLEYGLKDAQAQRDFALRQQQVDMQRQTQNDAARAATVSGVANMVGMAGTGYLGYKSLMGTNATNNRLLDIMGGQQAPASVAGSGSAGMLTPAGVGSGALTPPGMLQMPQASAPMLQAQTTFPAATLEAGGAVPSAGGIGTASMLGMGALGAGALYAGGQYVHNKTGLDQFTSTAIAPMVAPTMLAFDAVKGLGSFASDVFGW